MKLLEKIILNHKKRNKNKSKKNSVLNNLVVTNVVYKTNGVENEILTNILNFLLALIGVLGIVWCFKDFVAPNISLLPILIIAVIITLIINIAANLKKSIIWVTLASLIIILFIAFSGNNISGYSDFFNEVIKSMTRGSKFGVIRDSLVYAFCSLVALISAVIFSLSMRIKGGFIIVALFSVTVLFPIYYSYNFPNPLAIILVFIYLISCFVKIAFNGRINNQNVNKDRNKQENKNQKHFIQKICALVLVFSILSFSIANIVNPATSNTFPDIIRTVNSEVRAFISEVFREKIIDSTTISFGQLGKTDKIVYDFKPVAQFTTQRNAPAYLRMWTADTYKASTWINDSQSFKAYWNNLLNKSDKLNYGLEDNLTENNLNNYIYMDSNGFSKTFFDVLNIKDYEEFKENGFIKNNLTFYPLADLSLEKAAKMGIMNNIALPTVSIENPFFLKEQFGSTVDYSEYNTVKFQSEAFSYNTNIAQATHDEDFNEKLTALCEKYNKTAKQILENENADENLKAQILLEQEYGKYAKQKNTEISNDISDRVVALAKELNGKDVFETFDNIKNYLNENTSYTLSPGITPTDSDYIDYFLFKSKKGFCTHYASAAVTILRANGYPARYVEGYMAKYREGYGEYSPDKKIDILDSDGHAWVEIYFDGIGWVPFEVTPSFEIKIVEYNPLGNVEISSYKAEVNISTDDTFVTSEQSTDQVTEVVNHLLEKVFYAMLIALIIFVTVLLEIFIRRSGRNKKFKDDNNIRAVKYMFKFILKLFEMCNIKISKGEKLTSFAARADLAYPFAQKGDCVRVMEIFLKAEFDNGIIEQEQVEFIYDFIQNSIKEIYKQLPWYKKLYLLIIKAF